jgi:hypothetical protein
MHAAQPVQPMTCPPHDTPPHSRWQRQLVHVPFGTATCERMYPIKRPTSGADPYAPNTPQNGGVLARPLTPRMAARHSSGSRVFFAHHPMGQRHEIHGSKAPALSHRAASPVDTGGMIHGLETSTSSTSKVRAWPARQWLASRVTPVSETSLTTARAPLLNWTVTPASRPSTVPCTQQQTTLLSLACCVDEVPFCLLAVCTSTSPRVGDQEQRVQQRGMEGAASLDFHVALGCCTCCR